MTAVFYASAIISVIAAILVVTRTDPMHALIYLVTLFLSIASVLWTIGAPFAAALQVIVYAGAIAILLVFAVMILNPSGESMHHEKQMTGGRIWLLPLLLTGVLVAQFLIAFTGSGGETSFVGPKAVGISLFTTYLIAVELASLVLLAGLVAAFHVGALVWKPEAEDE